MQQPEYKNGLEALRAVANGAFRSPMLELYDMELVHAEVGVAELAVMPNAKFSNMQHRMHGGFAATVIDTALGCAVMTKLDPLVGFGTVDLKVNFVKKIDVSSGRLMCRGTILHAGRSLFTAEAKLSDGAGTLLAHGSGTFLVYPT
jgi:uncharacterized protein (TIGR00369 family)